LLFVYQTGPPHFPAREALRAPSPRAAGRGEMRKSFSRRGCVRGLRPRQQRTATNKGRRSAERRKPAIAVPRGTAARRIGARSPSGASRRRLLRRANARTQPRPRFTRARGCGRYPHRRSRLNEAPRTPVIMPEGTMPGPPGSGVTSPARRNRTRSAIRCVSRSRPSIERDCPV
jgi:hypothetical protein